MALTINFVTRMDDIQTFYLLKQKILAKYVDAYPYYTGSIHNFGNKEIAQLIDLIEKESNERVSEKWIYTHLKPTINSKLPRKDMLSIFCNWIGYNNWDEFLFLNKEQLLLSDITPEATEIHKPKNKIALYMAFGIMIIIAGVIIGFTTKGNYDTTICLKDKYTQKTIAPDKVTLYLFKNGKNEKLAFKDSCYALTTKKNDALVIVESPYYKPDTLKIDSNNPSLEFDLQPDDYAMMLRAYMNGNIADWNKRKQQLDNIISNDAVIQEIMFNEIGVEFLNKEEFIAKITTPASVVKTMEVVEIKYEGGKIISLKYMQKGK